MPRPSNERPERSPEPEELPDEVFPWPTVPTAGPRTRWSPSSEVRRWFEEHDPERRYMAESGQMTREWHRERGRRWVARGFPPQDTARVYFSPPEEALLPADPDPRRVLDFDNDRITKRRRS